MLSYAALVAEMIDVSRRREIVLSGAETVKKPTVWPTATVTVGLTVTFGLLDVSGIVSANGPATGAESVTFPTADAPPAVMTAGVTESVMVGSAEGLLTESAAVASSECTASLFAPSK